MSSGDQAGAAEDSIIATATGVHPGFKGCLTLELSNVGELPIEITPGMRICQLCVHKVESPDTDQVDSSQFVGSRMPWLGTIEQDEMVKKVAKAYTVKSSPSPLGS